MLPSFAPSNAAEQKQQFLDGQITNPSHKYENLNNFNFEEARERIDDLLSQIQQHSNFNHHFSMAYEDFARSFQNKVTLLQFAQLYNAGDKETRVDFAKKFMEINEQIYGKPDEDTYRVLLDSKLDRVRSQIGYGNRAESIRSALMAILPESRNAHIEAYAPSTETVEWLQNILVEDGDSLFGEFIDYIPSDDPDRKFNPNDIQEIFQNIIEKEFGAAASGWRVDIEPAQSINVKPTERRIVIPEARAPVSVEALKGLVVHEIGIHMMRAVTGADTDLQPLEIGLDDYYDFEEGLGRAMEQAVSGKYEPAGVNYYIIAGLSYYDSYDFRQIFEVMWRLSALDKAKNGSDLSDEQISKSRQFAYGSVMRIMRGTDTLPWFKDLAYYNGNAKAWQYIEDNKGDPDAFLNIHAKGKFDPFKDAHMQAVLETRSN